MITKEVIAYIANERGSGVSDESIKQALLQSGWKESDITEAFLNMGNSAPVSNNQFQPSTTAVAELPKAGDLLSRSFALYKKNFLALFVIALIPSAFSLIALFIEEGSYSSLIILALFGSFLAYTFSISASMALLTSDKESNLETAFTKGMERFLPVLFTSLVMLMIVFGGYLFFVIPGIIFSIIYGFSAIIAVAENKGVNESLATNRAYVMGRLGSVFYRLFVLVITVFALTLLAQLLIFILVSVFSIGSQNSVSSEAIEASYIAGIFTALIQAVTYAFSSSYLYTLYRDLKASSNTPIQQMPTFHKVAKIIGAIAMVAFIALAIVGLVIFSQYGAL
ncbi:MAG: hypothetical protein WDZ88_00300 [Candidatus Paceibacterota bacterium]